MSEWTISKIIDWTTIHFKSKGIESARLDGELLLAHTLKCKRLDLYLKFDQPLKSEELKSFKDLVLRRSKFEPVAYILENQEFYKRPFKVGPGVLIPRPETEHLVDLALSWAKTKPEDKILVLDVGCGSGAIAVSLAAENTKFDVLALDKSEKACQITHKNSELNSVTERLKVQSGDFLNWSHEKKFDLVVSNPPYVGRKSIPTLRPDVLNHEPEEALFGGETGSELLEMWIPKMSDHLKSEGLLLCEIGYDQGEIAKEIANKFGKLENIEIIRDYSGHPRVLKATKIREN